VEFVFENQKECKNNFYSDLQKHKMGSLALLDRIEDEVEHKFQSI